MIKSPVLLVAALMGGVTGQCPAAPGPFTPAALPYTPFPLAYQGSAVWVDFDGDGDVDISLNGLHGSDKIFQIWLKNGNTLTQQPTNVPGEKPSPGAHTSLAWADFNRDGRPDFARQYRGPYCPDNLCDGNIWGDRCEAWRNDGDGNFTSVFSRKGGDNGDMEWTDSNLDGYADISFTGYALMYPGIPTTTYDVRRGSATSLNDGDNFPFPLSAGTFAWLDYDRDGQTDFAYTGNQRVEYSYSNDKSELRRRNGFYWDRVPIDPPPYGNATVTWADVDLDGRPDLIMAGTAGWDLWRQTATGFVHLPRILAGGLPPVWGDLDNDGDLDCVTGSFSSPEAVIWENTGSATFLAGVTIVALVAYFKPSPHSKSQ